MPLASGTIMPRQKPKPPLHPPESIISHFLPLPADVVPTSGSSLALIGAAGTQKTALLLQAAVRLVTVNHQNDSNAIVLFLSAYPVSCRPPSVHHMPLVDKSNSHRILIHYFDSSADLIQFLVDYPQKRTFPRAIIIDDFHVFAERKFLWHKEFDLLTVASKILTAARDLTAFCGQQSGRNCYLLIGSQEMAYMRPQNKHSAVPENKTMLPPEPAEPLFPILNTCLENVVRLKRHEQSETTDQINIQMDYNLYHIFLYVQADEIYVNRVENQRLLPLPKETDHRIEDDQRITPY